MPESAPARATAGRSLDALYVAAWMYYQDGATQAQIAREMNVSRPTVSRLLTEARERGIVRIEVVHPGAAHVDRVSEPLAHALGIERAYVAPGAQFDHLGSGLAHVSGAAITDLGLAPGDTLVLSSGQAIHEVIQTAPVSLSSVTVVPAVGGQAEPEPWHQTNEIVRLAASHTAARPEFVFAQAMPSQPVYDALQQDPSFQRIRSLWEDAAAILVGVGAPTATRTSLSMSVPHHDSALQHAVGDVCLHFYDVAGQLLEFPGSDRMIRIPYDTLRAIPHRVAVAAGAHKALSIYAAAQLKMFNRLVTDEVTARAVLALIGSAPATPTTTATATATAQSDPASS